MGRFLGSHSILHHRQSPPYRDQVQETPNNERDDAGGELLAPGASHLVHMGAHTMMLRRRYRVSPSTVAAAKLSQSGRASLKKATWYPL